MASRNTEQIKERLSIEEVVSQYVELKPAGINMKGRCPFHSEKTPSFTVSPERQTYHCFGCGVGGDIFTFVQEIEGLDFKGALKLLADKAGVTLTYDKGVEKNDKDTLFEVLEAVTVYYQEQLNAHPDARAYLHARGITDATIADFRIGFAPEGWSNTLDVLKEKGYPERTIEQAGLIKKGDKGYYDRFRSRIMFPINDSVGRAVAFSGRIFGDDAKHDDVAKYMNSPETELYHKSRVLYGYDKARQAIRKRNFAVLVEGQMDLVATHQAKYTNTVALSGTALTPEHITLLSRMSKNVCIALDADAAGIASAGKSARLALRAGFDVKVVALPEGKDPADIIAQGEVEVWKDAIKSSKHIIDFLLVYIRAQAKDERDFKLRVEREVLPYVHDIASEIDTAHFIQRVAAQISVSEEVIRQTLSKMHVENTGIQASASTDSQKKVSHKRDTQSTEEELMHMYLWQKGLKDPSIDVAQLYVDIEELVTPVGAKALESRCAEDTRTAFRLESLYETELEVQEAVHDLLLRLRHALVRKDLEKATADLKQAELAGKSADVAKYEALCHELHQKLAQL